MRLPHGYWRSNKRWLLVIIGSGMPAMLAVASLVQWWGLGSGVLMALLLGAILTPTDPVVTTPIVTGSLADERISERVRHDLSAESGLNDGLGYLFVMAPILLMSKPDQALQELVVKVFLWEILGAVVLGAVAGYLLGKLFVFVRERDLMEETAYLSFTIPLALLLIGGGKLVGVNDILLVFIGAAVFGQVIPQRDEAEEDKVHDATAQLFLLPIFILIGIALPLEEWARLGWWAVLVIGLAVFLRRALTMTVLRPLLRSTHTKAETMFLGWFAPIGVSALFYATMAERELDIHILPEVTLAITISVVIHGISSAPLSLWLQRRTPQDVEQS